jgi:hypothetical protein
MTTYRGGTTTPTQEPVSAGQHPDRRVPWPQTRRNHVPAGQRLAYHRTNTAYHPSDLRERELVRVSRTSCAKTAGQRLVPPYPYGVASSWYAATPGVPAVTDEVEP